VIPDFNKILTKLSNPFIKLDKSEEEQLKEIELAVKRDIRQFSKEAKELYQDKRYEKLKNEFKSIYEQNLKLIIYYDNEDIQKYAMKMRTLQIQLRTLQSIFNTPEGFIKKEEEIDRTIKNKV
jgi:adenylate kinase family enzyme